MGCFCWDATCSIPYFGYVNILTTLIKITLSGDGTNIGKRINVVNITSTILNEKKTAMGEKGNYILAVLKVTESYETFG